MGVFYILYIPFKSREKMGVFYIPSISQPAKDPKNGCLLYSFPVLHKGHEIRMGVLYIFIFLSKVEKKWVSLIFHEIRMGVLYIVQRAISKQST